MPTYEYACTACDHRLEAVQSFTDGPLTKCPQCSGRLRKLFSSVGVVFRGPGFYRTDSRAGGSVGESKDGSSRDGSSRGGSGDNGSSNDGGNDRGGKNGGGKADKPAADSSSSPPKTSSGSMKAPAAS